MKKILFIVFAGTLLLSACGPEPEPTLSVDEIQGTAVAAAFTMIAQTQAAMPTNTPIPPTETPSPTPLPTNTVVQLAVPTQPLIQPTATTASGEDDCDHLLDVAAAGPTSPIQIVNQTKAQANVSLGLYTKNAFGQCGYIGYTIPKKGSIKIDFPRGDIYGYAWILEPINTTVYGGPWRPNNTDKWTIYFNENTMWMVGP